MTDPEPFVPVFVDTRLVGDVLTDLLVELTASVAAGDTGNRLDGASAALDRLRSTGLAALTPPSDTEEG